MKIIKKYSLIFLCMVLACILYAKEAIDIIDEVKTILDTGTWVPKHSLAVLKSKDRDYMANFVPDIESFTFDGTELQRSYGIIPFDSDDPPQIVFWYERGLFLEAIKIDDFMGDGLYIGSPNNYIMILDASYMGNTVQFSGKLGTAMVDTMLDWSKLTENEEVFTMFFIFDGDYLDVYIDEVAPENLFYTFVSINDATVNEYKSLMASNTCDLSNVTWPRYADGSSDYDDTILLTHIVGKTYRTTDNLRLRETEGVTGEALFTVPKDTVVKILTRGTTETIDDIASEWVQVEVVKDTIDTTGKEIKKGTIGWCFGGYVTTIAEDIVYKASSKTVEEIPKKVIEAPTDTENEAVVTGKEAIPLTTWLLLGGGLVLVCAIVVLVLVRKKK